VRLVELYPAIPTSVVELIEQLLSASREERSPPLDGRSHYLRWLRDQLEQGHADVLRVEERSSAPVAIGPAAIALAPQMQASSPQLPAETRDRLAGIEEPAGRSPVRHKAVTSGGHGSLTAAKAQRPETTDVSSARAPVPPVARADTVKERALRQSRELSAEAAGEADAARERWRRQRMEDVAPAGNHIGSTHRLRQRRRLVWSSMAVAFAVDIAVWPLIFQPGGALSGLLVMLAALTFAMAMGWLNVLIAARLDISLPLPPLLRGPKLSLPALLVARVIVAILVAVLAGQALMVRVLAPDLSAPIKVQSDALHVSLRQLNDRRAKEGSEFKSEVAILRAEADRLAAEVKANPTSVSQTTEQRLQAVLKTRTELLASHSRSEAALLTQSASVARQIAAAETKLSEGRGRVQLLYRFVQRHFAAIVLYVLMILWIGAIELVPSALAALPFAAAEPWRNRAYRS
jgi:hypothetical protein